MRIVSLCGIIVLLTSCFGLPVENEDAAAKDFGDAVQDDKDPILSIFNQEAEVTSHKSGWWKKTKAPLSLHKPFEAMSPRSYTTVDGCECESSCSAEGDGFTVCDWCWTKNGCGKKSWKTLDKSWGYCKYPGMKGFDAMSHTKKMDAIWTQMTDDASVGKSHSMGKWGYVGTMIGSVTGMVEESMRTTFDSNFEVLTKKREKVIHKQGVHCKFELAVDKSSKFTGIFAPGTSEGLIRMGSATPTGYKMFPGLGIKFLRSGVRSANFVALSAMFDKKESQDGWDFWKETFSNHVAPPSALMALGKFQQASGCITMVGLSDVCTYTQSGEAVDSPKFPYEVQFKPSAAIRASGGQTGKWKESGGVDAEMLDKLSAIRGGVHLFDVFAKASPGEGEDLVKLGTMTTTSQCHRSLFGDEKLFFQHQRMEDDFKLKPDWIAEVKAKNIEGCNDFSDDGSKFKCPGV